MHAFSTIVRRTCGISAVLMLTASTVGAQVTRLEITARDAVAGGQSFGSAGPFVNIRGRVHGEIDPRDRRNRIIQDIDLAPRNARGRVDYVATFSLMMPADLSKSSGVLVYSVVNRGNGAATPGPDGHISLVSGWQGDVAPTATNQTIQVPVARSGNGSALTGPVLARFSDLPKGTNTAGIRIGSLGTGFYPPATLDTTRATLTFHTGETTAGSTSGQGTVPSSEWAFADCRTTPFPGTPDPSRICLAQGFDPARLYDLVYTAKDPLVLGIGFAATRDIVDFFRHAAADANGTANPVAGRVTHGIALGTSQSGNFIKTFVHLGFNEDAAGRPVFDGVLPYIAGRQLAMNVRFAAPGGAAGLYEPGSEPALWWGTYKDAERRRSSASLLDRCLRTRTCPKVVEAFGATEFWGLRMSPGLVGTDARHDIALPGNVRRYYMPGTNHGGGAGGFQIAQTGNERCSLPQNPNPMADTHRALVAALIEWVVKGTEPPPSRYPTLADGQLAPAATVAAAFPKIPGVAVPEVNHVLDYDFGDRIRVPGTFLASSPGCPRPSGRWCRCSCPASTRTATRSPAWLRRCIRRRSAAISGGTSRHRVSSKDRSADRGGITICGDARRAGKGRRSEALDRGALRHAGRLRLRGDARGQRTRARALPAARRRRPSDRQCGKEPHPAVERRERRGSAAHCGYAVQMTEQSPDLPLRGLKVIDFTRVLAGPLCTMLLGDMGAEVIKIEDPRHGDDTRAWAPFVDGWSTYYLTVNRNKKSVAVDLKSEDGRALMEDLFRSADVVIENFRPGTLERLGFGSGSRDGAQSPARFTARFPGTADRAAQRRGRLRHGDPGGVGADGRHRLSGNRTHQGWRGDHRLPGRTLRGPGHPARAHSARSEPARGSSWTSRCSIRPCPCSACPSASSQPPVRVPAASATNIHRWRPTSRTLRQTGRSSSRWPIRGCGPGSVRRWASRISSTIRGSRTTPIVSPTATR